MDRMLYVMMSGAKETLLAQANASNNLANANTTGFLADFNQFRSMPVFGSGHPTRVYALDERPATNFDLNLSRAEFQCYPWPLRLLAQGGGGSQHA